MVLVYLDGHDFTYEVNELVKLFFFGEEISFIQTENEYTGEGFLIKNHLIKVEDDYSAIAIVVYNNDVISKYKVDSINNIDIKRDEIVKKIKTGIKQSIYVALSNILEVKVPWGILTGVRPTKIVHDLLDKGLDENSIYDILTKEYKLFPYKANTIVDIAKIQREYIYPLSKDRFSLYVSIPFCPTRCIYCSFPSNSMDVGRKYVDEYTEKIIYELKSISKCLNDKKIHTVYIGGGTPTAIPTKNLDSIIKSIYELYGKENIKEITVEAGRPDTIDKEKLQMLKSNDINRISINPQTMNEDTLKIIGRKHTEKDIIEAFALAKNIGFDVINMDIIVGLPEEGTDELANTLDKILKLNPENLTVHTLAIKRASIFSKSIKNFSIESQSTIENMLDMSRKYAERMNLRPYYLYRQKHMLGNFENTGYSIEGKECIYNMLIMEEKETILAVGAGGVSKIYYPNENRLERVPNVKNLKDYLERIDEMVERKRMYIDTI